MLPPGGMLPPRGVLPPKEGVLPLGGRGGVPVVDPQDGYCCGHPTGMHSCVSLFVLFGC